LYDNGCDIVNGTNGDMIRADIVIAGRGVKQGPVSFVKKHAFQEL